MAATSWSKSLMSYWWFGVSNCGCPVDVVLGVGADAAQPAQRVLAAGVGRDREVVRVGGRGVVLERLVVRDVVVLEAVLAGAGGQRAGQPGPHRP